MIFEHMNIYTILHEGMNKGLYQLL